MDAGTDPRELERQQKAAKAAKKAQEAAEAVTVAEAWDIYVAERTPHWDAYHLRDHHSAAQGLLHEFMDVRIVDVDSDMLKEWAEREGQARATSARLALRLLRAFLNWCADDKRFALVAPRPNPAASKKVNEALGKAKPRRDHLTKSQLPAWFAAVQTLPSAEQAAYLQTLLLTGARSGELLALRWEDVNSKWRGLTIRDKAESKGGEDGTREIPLTPYVWHLLAALPRRGPYVFAGPNGKPMSRPYPAHGRACAVAGIEGLTVHGLRRSFKSLSEWVELPTGVVAQIMGLKPSATAEKHYTVRPLDLLRLHHEKLEAWILEQADVQFDATKDPGKLRVVA